MEFLETFVAVPALVVITYLVAEGIKLIKNGAFNKYLPVLCGLIGAVLATVAYFICPALIPCENIFDAIATGIVSGLSATGINQIFKQLSKKKEE